jgi:hypothetical protein
MITSVSTFASGKGAAIPLMILFIGLSFSRSLVCQPDAHKRLLQRPLRVTLDGCVRLGPAALQNSG